VKGHFKKGRCSKNENRQNIYEKGKTVIYIYLCVGVSVEKNEGMKDGRKMTLIKQGLQFFNKQTHCI